MSRREVVITGIGLSTPIGTDLHTFEEGLFVRAAPFELYVSEFGKPLPIARTHDAELEARSWPSVDDRCSRLAQMAAGRALQHAGVLHDQSWLHGCTVAVGCGCGPTASLHAAYEELFATRRTSGLAVLRCLPSAVASAVAMQFKLRAGVQTYTSACASSALAIGEAMRAIRHGYADQVLVGGVESPLGGGTMKAWDSMRVLAPSCEPLEEACRPFDQSRRGLVLGEGAAFLVLEHKEAALQRGARIWGQLAGFGISSDAHHWTEPSSAGQIVAMQAALQDAGIAAKDVVAVNAHGTATPTGDRVELASLGAVFDGHPVLVSSTKSVHGHLLGASGAIELAACLMSLQREMVPHTRHLNDPEPHEHIHLVRGGPHRLEKSGWMLSNSFAFGGSNACLVVGPAP